MSFAKPEKKDANSGPSLMCSAHGCPLRWSVKIESPLCSYHAWEDPVKWPYITDELRRIGIWKLETGKESPTVRDMKTRLRTGFKFPPIGGPAT